MRISAEISGVRYSPLAIEPVPFEEGTLTPPSYYSGEVGDPGVLIPKFQLGGSVYAAPAEWIELGVFGQYASARWSTANLGGVLSPPSDPFLIELGVGMRLNLLDLEPMVFSLLTEFGGTSVQETTFVTDPEYVGTVGPAPYRVHHESQEFHLRTNAALSIGGHIGPLFIHGLIGGQPTYTNIGFDTLDRTSVDTRNPYWMGYAGGGLEFLMHGLAVGTHVYVPFGGDQPISYGVRGQFYLAYQFSLTGEPAAAEAEAGG